MRIITALSELRQWRREQAESARVTLVPTMGALHEGHLQLVDDARSHGDLVVMSIFVNPLQFRPGEDFERYPRRPDEDARKASARGVDLLFTPNVEEMYGAGIGTRIVPGSAASRWEGAIRPGHFEGVLTVVAKLFNLVQPHLAIFGQKDIQQVTLIRQMISDLNFPIILRIHPTVREPDGLALSSRNVYLNSQQRAAAMVIPRALEQVVAQWRSGVRAAPALEAAGREFFERAEGVTLEYIAITDPVGLDPVSEVRPGSVVAVAARVGATRLIDNVILEEGGA